MNSHAVPDYPGPLPSGISGFGGDNAALHNGASCVLASGVFI